jgi:hypothetical protein
VLPCHDHPTAEIFNIASPTRDKARRTPNLQSRKWLNFQKTNARARNIEVEEVETVESVEARSEGYQTGAGCKLSILPRIKPNFFISRKDASL